MLYDCLLLCYWPLQKYTLLPNAVKLWPPEELVHTGHTYNYVNLISKATFSWVYKLLAHGYKHTLEMKNLGSLAPVKYMITKSFEVLVCFRKRKCYLVVNLYIYVQNS